MKARRLIDGAALGPAALKTIYQAFDEAWAEIALHFGSSQVEIEAARVRLAEAILEIADEDSQDVEALKRAAVTRMPLGHLIPADFWRNIPDQRAQARASLPPRLQSVSSGYGPG